MKILITGNYGLGKSITDFLIKNSHEVTTISLIDLYSNNLTNIINNHDVFINNEYNDTIQTKLFEMVYNNWKYENKTIVNILTSALIFGGTNKKYIDDKRDLESKTFEVRTDDKDVRVINVYPNTLESTKTAPNKKLKYQEVSDIIKFVIELPQDIEIFQIGISKTKLKIDTSII